MCIYVCHPHCGGCLPPCLLPLLTRNALTRACSCRSLDGAATQSAPDARYCREASWCRGVGSAPPDEPCALAQMPRRNPAHQSRLVDSTGDGIHPKGNLNLPFLPFRMMDEDGSSRPEGWSSVGCEDRAGGGRRGRALGKVAKEKHFFFFFFFYTCWRIISTANR